MSTQIVSVAQGKGFDAAAKQETEESHIVLDQLIDHLENFTRDDITERHVAG